MIDTVEYAEKLMRDLSSKIIVMAIEQKEQVAKLETEIKILRAEKNKLERKIADYQQIAPHEDRAVSRIDRRLERIK